jgi:hypothetical protein
MPIKRRAWTSPSPPDAVGESEVKLTMLLAESPQVGFLHPTVVPIARRRRAAVSYSTWILRRRMPGSGQ